MFSHLAFKSKQILCRFLHTPALYFSAFCFKGNDIINVEEKQAQVGK